jgi:hypothetical protein
LVVRVFVDAYIHVTTRRRNARLDKASSVTPRVRHLDQWQVALVYLRFDSDGRQVGDLRSVCPAVTCIPRSAFFQDDARGRRGERHDVVRAMVA